MTPTINGRIEWPVYNMQYFSAGQWVHAGALHASSLAEARRYFRADQDYAHLFERFRTRILIAAAGKQP